MYLAWWSMEVEQLRDQDYTLGTYLTAAALSSKETQPENAFLQNSLNALWLLVVGLLYCLLPQLLCRWRLCSCLSCVCFYPSVTFFVVVVVEALYSSSKACAWGSYTIAAEREGCLIAPCLLLSILSLGRKAFLRPLCLKWNKSLQIIQKYVWQEGNGVKSELYTRTVPELFSPAYEQLQYKAWKYVTMSLATYVLVNQTVGGNVPGQWVVIAHASEALRLSLVWVKCVPKSALPSFPQHISGAKMFQGHSQKSACQQLPSFRS